VKGRRERRHKQLLDDLKEHRVYWNLEEKALCGELALEVAMNFSQNSIRNDDT